MTAIPIGTEAELATPPKDGVAAVVFGAETDLLLVASWDAHLYLHDAPANKLRAKVPFDAALLDCCFGDTDAVSYAAGLNRQVMRIDWNTLRVSILGTHQDAVKTLVRCRHTGLLFSGSWDGTVTAWDAASGTRAARIELPGKAYTADCVGHHLVVGMSGRLINIYDTRRLDEPLQRRESSLKYQTRCVRVFPTGEGYVCTSIEGRVAVEYFDPSPEVQARKYAFKCHRAPLAGQENMETVYPVNAAAFHPTHGTFCTGGSDGVVSVWDPVHRKRIRNYPKHPASISAAAFSRDGALLATASSYCYEEGEKDHPPDSVFVRSLEEGEVRGKGAQQ